MPKRKVTFVYDPAKEEGQWGLSLERRMQGWSSIDPESITVEELPDPPIRQRLVMEIESDPEMGPFDPTGWAHCFMERDGLLLPMSFKEGRRRILSFKKEPDA